MDDEEVFWQQLLKDEPVSREVFMGSEVSRFDDDSAVRPKVGRHYEAVYEDRSVYYDCKDPRLDFTGGKRPPRSRLNGDQGLVTPKKPTEYTLGGIRVPLQ